MSTVEFARTQQKRIAGKYKYILANVRKSQIYISAFQKDTGNRAYFLAAFVSAALIRLVAVL